MTLEYYSSLALVTSAVVYMLALFAHAAEWAAAGRMGLRTQRSVELVGASAGAAGGGTLSPEPVEGPLATLSKGRPQAGSSSSAGSVWPSP